MPDKDFYFLSNARDNLEYYIPTGPKFSTFVSPGDGSKTGVSVLLFTGFPVSTTIGTVLLRYMIEYIPLPGVVGAI